MRIYVLIVRAHPKLMEFVDEELTLKWKSVLLVCRRCRADGDLPLARTKRTNVATNARRAQRVRFRAPVPQADEDGVVSLVEGSDISPSMPSNAPRILMRRRKAGSSSEPGATSSRRNSLVRG